MELHRNARTCPHSRRLIVRRVRQGWTVREAAQAAGCSERTASKWLARARAGDRVLADRSSAPRRVPSRTPDDRVRAIEALRRLRFTAAEIAETLAMPLSTTSCVLTRIGLGKRSRLEPLEPIHRYQRARPGELLHIDIKRLGRINGVGHRILGHRRSPQASTSHNARTTGWEYVHVCVDDATRLAYAEVLVDEKADTATGFLARAVAFYAAHGITVEGVMTDNGSAYRSILHAAACHALGLRHLRTRPYRPQTNGKAERFIRTLLDGWAYGAIYGTSAERTRALPGWLDHYNRRRPHGSLSHQPPIRRLAQLMNNAPGYYI
jgi:transposase InsO family protein